MLPIQTLISKNIHSLGYRKRATAACAITSGIEPFGAVQISDPVHLEEDIWKAIDQILCSGDIRHRLLEGRV